MAKRSIDLPNNWSPRFYQKPLWDYLASEGKRAVVAWHRRSGKDDTMLHHNACAAFERIGNYWYMLPEYNQCRKAVWDAVNPHTGKKRIDEAFPVEIRKKTLEQEMKIVFLNDSTFQLMGSDNYNALVGSPPVGLTFSEYALSNPSSWGFLRPIMLENGGWAIFNSTPRGHNHFEKLVNMAQAKDSWFSQILTVDDTQVFTPEQLRDELDELVSEHGEAYGKSLWLQEYFCSFDAALPGSIWGDALTKLRNGGRVKDLPVVENYPVHTAWDLGHDDDTAIWFYQVIGNQIHVIDAYAGNFEEPEEHAQVLVDKGYYYGTHWLPHDARPKRYGMGAGTVLQQFIKLIDHHKVKDDFQLGSFAITPSFSKEDGIQAARKTFQSCYFDKTRCTTAKNGRQAPFEALKAYRRKYDEENKTFSKEPVHDWSSHYSDAFRYLSLTWQQSKHNQIILTDQQKLLAGNVTSVNFGAIKQAHFAKRRAERG